jgi:hypothetical protein
MVSVGATTPVRLVNAGKQDTPFLLEAPILNFNPVELAYNNADFAAGIGYITISPGSKLYFAHFTGALWALSTGGTQTINIAYPSNPGQVPVFNSDISAWLVAALPIDLISASGQSFVGGQNVSITLNTYIFAANANAFVGEQVYNVPVNFEFYILTATAGNLTVYRNYNGAGVNSAEVFAVAANTPARCVIPVDYLETINLKYSATGTFTKFMARQLGVTFATVTS